MLCSLPSSTRGACGLFLPVLLLAEASFTTRSKACSSHRYPITSQRWVLYNYTLTPVWPPVSLHGKQVETPLCVSRPPSANRLRNSISLQRTQNSASPLAISPGTLSLTIPTAIVMFISSLGTIGSGTWLPPHCHGVQISHSRGRSERSRRPSL